MNIKISSFRAIKVNQYFKINTTETLSIIDKMINAVETVDKNIITQYTFATANLDNSICDPTTYIISYKAHTMQTGDECFVVIESTPDNEILSKHEKFIFKFKIKTIVEHPELEVEKAIAKFLYGKTYSTRAISLNNGTTTMCSIYGHVITSKNP